MQFPPKFLDELRARLPVSEVVGKRVKLRKAGREWKGLSPFMKERSPSFFVNDQKGFYHDFSSGKHGDIFTFVIETEGVTFAEAVERLAALAGMLVPVVSEDAASFEIGSLTDLRAWLQQQPYQVSTVYAARAALRAIPGLATALGPKGGALREFGSSIVLPTFRAVSAAWVISMFPTRALHLRPAAASAAEAAFAAANKINSTGAVSACGAAARAAAAAARAATESPAEANAAAQALELAFVEARKTPTLLSHLAIAGATADIKALAEGFSPNEMMARGLWLDGIPSPLFLSEWSKLESALLRTAEDWGVWTDWYQSRLKGRPPVSEGLEIARLKLPLDIWAQSPRVVNAQIKKANPGRRSEASKSSTCAARKYSVSFRV
jgi:hypothetical protein